MPVKMLYRDCFVLMGHNVFQKNRESRGRCGDSGTTFSESLKRGNGRLAGAGKYPAEKGVLLNNDHCILLHRVFNKRPIALLLKNV